MAKKSKKKSNSASLEQLESNCSPILEIKSTDENYFFNVVPHPSKPLLSIGLATGHVFTLQYDAQKLQDHVNVQRKASAKSEKENKNQTEQSSSTTEKSKVSKNKIFWKKFNLKDLAEGNFDQEFIKILWKTKRHKGSCRCLVFDPKDDGETMYSIGTDNILKKADTMSGKVIKKIDLNSVINAESETKTVKITKLVKSPTHNFLLLGSESGNVIVLDSNTLKVTNNELKQIHMGDAINDMFQYVKKSVYKYISLGQTTMASWDSRFVEKNNLSNDSTQSNKSVHLSDDQEDEILCGTFVNPDEDDTIVCGMGEGILTLWKSSKNDLQDQLSRIKIAKGESIDCVVPTLQDDNCVWCGCSNGNIYKVNTKMGKIVEIRKHSKFDEVTFLDLDFEYRVVSGGMDSLKVWEFLEDGDDQIDVSSEDSASDSENDSFSDSSDNDDDLLSDSASDSESESLKSDDSQIWEELNNKNSKTQPASKPQDVKAELLAELESSSDEEGSEQQKSIETVINTTHDNNNINKKHKLDSPNIQPLPNKKNKKQLLKAKQLKNIQNHEHGIRKFEGL